MEEIKIYIEEVKRKEDGSFDIEEYYEKNIENLRHDWFVLPVTREEILERIGLDIDKDEYYIRSYEGNINIPRLRFVEQFNDLYERLQEFEGTPFGEYMGELQCHFIRRIDRLIDNQEYFKFYPGYSDFGEFAHDRALEENPKAGYAEIESYQEYVEKSGHYLMVSGGIFEYDV